MKADLHLHSKYSDRPSEWFLRRIGAPESFVEPAAAYRFCRERGMDFVTLTDHNCIDGALSIAHLPGTFLSVEITTYFPEDGCKIHCLAHGISEAQFREIQAIRENIYDLQRLLSDEQIIHTIAHPLYRVNDRLTADHVEKLLLLFPRFERINGGRHDRAALLVETIFAQLTPAAIEAMANRQNLAPQGSEPWRKLFTGGSDDHCGVYAAAAYTETPAAATAGEFLDHLRAGRHHPGGTSGTSLRLAHSLYHIACSYYTHRFTGNGGGNPVIAELFRRVSAAAPAAEPESPGRLRTLGRRIVRHYRLNRLSPMERDLVETLAPLLQHRPPTEPVNGATPAAAGGGGDRRAFDIASRVGQQLGFVFTRQLIEHAAQGRLIESLQAFASLGPVALSLAPYIAAFGSQHRDEAFLAGLTDRFPWAAAHRQRGTTRAWFTDTFSDINGVAFSIRTIARHLNRRGTPVRIVTALAAPPSPEDGLELVNFKPLGEFPVPEYPELKIPFPPFLEIVEYLERENIGEIMISTPGTLGLTALAAARLLGLPTVGFYHTDIPRYVNCLTGDETLEPLAWKAMQWFYGSMDRLYVPSRNYLERLAENGFARDRMRVLPRGVDLERFNPGRRSPAFLSRYGLNGGLKYLYVGRISREKNVEILLEAFRSIERQDGFAGDLVVVGDGPEREALEQRYAAGNVVFTGFLHGDELARAYAAADVFVFPSATDTFGNVVLEAQASGLPAIVADQGGPPEIIAGRRSGLVVEAGRTDALADAMRRLAADPALRADLGRRALQTARDYSWDAALAKF